MPVFLITGYDGQETIFYRETPHQNGVGPILNEAISKLSSNPNSMIIIESLHEDSPEPQMEQHIPHSEYQDFYVDEWDAESTKKSGKVITMSGKPHKPRKLKQDKGISPEEAINRISFRSESTGWVIDDITIYDDTYGSKADGSLYNPETNERIDFEEAEISMDIYIPPMENIYVDYDDDDDLESVVEESMMEAEGFYDEDGVGAKHMASESSNPTGGNTGDQIVSWEYNGLSSPSGPPSDIFWAEGSNKLPVAVIDFEGVSEKYKNMSLDELADLDIQELADNFDIETLIELRIMAAKREAPYWETKGVDFDFENESFTDYPSGIFQDAIWAHNEYGAEGKKNCGCGQDPCKTYGAESQEFHSSLDESFDEIL